MDGHGSGGLMSTVSRRKDLPDDLACFLQQQKQRQARLETTMRSFPSTGDMEQDKLDQKKKRNTHEVKQDFNIFIDHFRATNLETKIYYLHRRMIDKVSPTRA